MRERHQLTKTAHTEGTEHLLLLYTNFCNGAAFPQYTKINSIPPCDIPLIRSVNINQLRRGIGAKPKSKCENLNFIFVIFCGLLRVRTAV